MDSNGGSPVTRDDIQIELIERLQSVILDRFLSSVSGEELDTLITSVQRRELDPQAAILESVRSRIRPIFMTTLTTVFGLAPLVLFPGAGSELYRGLGSVVLGGLIVSTLFTLLLVPTLFSIMMDAKAKLSNLIGQTGVAES